MTKSSFINPEDSKLETLARATHRRTGSEQAAALRDSTGRTYVAINISTPSFSVDSIAAVFTVAMASQISDIESVVIIGAGQINVGPVREYAPNCLIWRINASGEITVL
jgi:predicted tellurium resistance membrane protein TerC